MKKLIALLTVAGFLTFGISNALLAQEENQPEQPAQVEQVVETVAQTNPLAAPETDATFHEVLKKQFIDGGWEFMSVILLILVLGLAVSIERIIYLTLSTTNTKKLLAQLEETLNKGGIEKAKDLCRDTRGPVASIFYQGLMRYNDGMEEVEKSVVSYGSVMTGNLESGASWITLFIALGPMLGFMGTVIGMIQAFDAIAAAGDISPTVVAGGMKVALLTTIFGIIVALILQVFYNYILSKIEHITSQMEESAISLMDIIAKYKDEN